MASRKAKSAWTEADQQTLTEQNGTPAADGQSIDCDVCHVKIKLKNAFHLHEFYHTKETVIQKPKGDGEGGEGKEEGKDDAEMGGVEERDDGDKVMDDSETQTIVTIHGHCSTDKHKAGLVAKKSGKKQKTLSQAWGTPAEQRAVEVWVEANSGTKGNAAKAVNPEKWGELEKRVKNFKDRRTNVKHLKLLDFLETDDFMKKVIPLYKEGKLDGTPWLDLSRAFVNRYLGWKNVPLGEQGSALVHALCLAGGEAVRNDLSTYLVGISERWWRRSKSKYEGGVENIYDIEPPDLAKHLETGMKRAPAAWRKDGKYGATLCMDGTKITRKHVYYLRVCQWIGGCYPKQCLSGEDYDPSHNPLQINELAEYVTTGLLVLHDVRLTVIVLGAKLHKELLLNDEGKFRDDLIECVLNYPSIKLLNVCFDGDTVQGPWVVKHIEKFLSGEISYIASSCTPHVRKCIHRAVVMGSCLLSIGPFPIDAGLFPFLPSVPVRV
uniref:C2H2-type domain-containing protein n=1 Tax=Chromera velia CCMP2878 TaxID=1169474 RepID=A0A0G4HXW3_9ALVE|eukprot:Cvel_9361.t1-p1 / transcript=Cvel_9361.t1 / gene=Cvel_9361 / organism=Chromera_velia_CCMP2878 / gene_product=hypothetical protein / transcript_product=hypothetical protein / location=Cvel_scaffold537:55725-58525(+) / protein_length=492 / sequence_SO=supercontig / SO=protein_coding / is_pseudo=false